jgi:hypothetical protein
MKMEQTVTVVVLLHPLAEMQRHPSILLLLAWKSGRAVCVYKAEAKIRKHACLI